MHWEDVCKPCHIGGLGLRQAKEFNLALLAKLAWQMMSNPEKLWVKVLKQKYVKGGDFLKARVSTRASWGWKSIVRGRSVVEGCMSWRVGDGKSINCWSDKWVGASPLRLTNGVETPEELATLKVSDFILQDMTWDIVKLRDMLPDDFVDVIRGIPIPVDTQRSDRIYWAGEDTGKFTVCFAFNFIAGQEEDDHGYDWSWLWKINCWEMVKSFLWILLKGRLLTNLERARRQLTEDGTCSTCNEEEESIRHLFWDCFRTGSLETHLQSGWL